MDASPICRGQNLTLETVLMFIYAMPKSAMPKSEFNAFAESRMRGWTQTHSQIARQMALYYEDNGICIPRFLGNIDIDDVVNYAKNWACNYFIPNPYTPSLRGQKPTTIYAYLKKEIKRGNYIFDEACNSIFGIALNNLDKVRVYLNSFTDIIIDNNEMELNDGIFSYDEVDLNPFDEEVDAKTYYEKFNITLKKSDNQPIPQFSLPLQQIYYGAPGTGKSHTINEITKQQPEENVFRTTFHPDSDYSTFVGCYKPTTERVRCYGLNSVGETKTIMNLERGSASPLEENRIIYQFVPQAFTRAYVQAWNNAAEDVFLIIEEINRGNCAQIFGDLFQLLDRGDDGRSCYPIDADADLRQHLEKELGAESEGIKNGKLCLPANLHIWATMNTSDQSLFPIDSAFKRRWEWHYVPIQKPDSENYIINIAGTHYDWWAFLCSINKVIYGTTNSEDKKMGYFFVKAKEGVIDANQFVGKVLFYIWNDVFKNYGFDNHIFSKGEKEKFEFSNFFDAKGDANIAEVNAFLQKLISPINQAAETPATEQTDSQSAETEA